MPTVTVVLLNYNNYDPDTRRCLHSIRALEDASIHAVVVDNASSDGCAERIADEFPEVTVLRQPSNLGFAGGNNRGIEWALGQNSNYVLVLNNDTEVVDRRVIPDMISVLESNPRIGIIAPRVLDAVRKEEQRTTLTAPSWTLRERLLRRPTHHKSRLGRDTVSVEGISAVCWLIPARVFREIGFLDENIFIYAEDNEFCYRIRKAGLMVGQFNRIAVRHYFQSTKIKSLRSRRHRLGYVNHIYALRKNGASFPLVAAITVATSLRLFRHLLIESPKESLHRETVAYAAIIKDMVKQLASGATSIRLGPDAQ